MTPSNLKSSFIILVLKKSAFIDIWFSTHKSRKLYLQFFLRYEQTYWIGLWKILFLRFNLCWLKVKNILNNIIIVNKVARSILFKKVKGMVLKLNFTKTFDSIRLNFLLKILAKFSFMSRWLGELNYCINYKNINTS